MLDWYRFESHAVKSKCPKHIAYKGKERFCLSISDQILETNLRPNFLCKLCLGHIHTFIVPMLNYEADHHSDIIDLFYKSIFTTDIPSDEIVLYREKKIEEKHYPNHTQSVKRAVKLVTEAPYRVCGFQRRDGFIRSGIASRNMISIADTKTPSLLPNPHSAHYSREHL